MSERKKYNWRTHEWKVGDRCLIKETEFGFDRFVGVVKRDQSDFENAMIIEDPETQDTYVVHRAECIPLRPKSKAVEIWVPKIWTEEDRLCLEDSGNKFLEEVPHEKCKHLFTLFREVRKPKESP